MNEPAFIRQHRAALARHPAGKPLTAGLTARAKVLAAYERETLRPLYLIACSGSKLDHAAPARELYTGQAFRFAVRAAADGDFLILSAKHGIVDPSTMLEPYNVTLSTMSATERARWAADVAEDLELYAHRPIVVLAGADYAAACSRLPRATYPLKGLGIGQQLQCLKTMAEELEADAAEDRAALAAMPSFRAAAQQLALF